MAGQAKNDGCGLLVLVVLVIVVLSKCTGQSEPTASVTQDRPTSNQTAAAVEVEPALSMYVIASKANCRSEPKPGAAVVQQFGIGDQVDTGAAQNNWLAVDSSTSDMCWIKASLLSEERPEPVTFAAPATPLRTFEAPEPASGLSCEGKRVCRQMDSCEEAYHYLNQCGVGRLDGDGDGVPCESIC